MLWKRCRSSSASKRRKRPAWQQSARKPPPPLLRHPPRPQHQPPVPVPLRLHGLLHHHPHPHSLMTTTTTNRPLLSLLHLRVTTTSTLTFRIPLAGSKMLIDLFSFRARYSSNDCVFFCSYVDAWRFEVCLFVLDRFVTGSLMLFLLLCSFRFVSFITFFAVSIHISYVTYNTTEEL